MGHAASQLLASTSGGERWAAVALSEAAAVAAERGAPEAAALLLRRSLEEPAPPDLQADILRRLGEAEAATGAPGAPDHLDAALNLTARPEERARMLLSMGRICYARGQPEQAVDCFDRGLREIEGHHPDLALQLTAERGVVGTLPGVEMTGGPDVSVESVLDRPQETLTLSERAYLAFRALVRGWAGAPRDEVLTLAHTALGGRALLEQETSDGTALYAATGVLHNYGELLEDLRLLTDAIADARRRGSINGFAMASYCRGWPNLERGHIADAIADADQAIDAERYGWEQFLAVACANKAVALMELDDLAGADAVIEQLTEERWGDSPTWVQVLHVRGRAALAHGRAREALASFEEWGARMGPVSPVMYNEWRSFAALAHLALDDRASAVRLAEEELELVRDVGSPRALGVALRALGLAQGGPTGLERLENAVDVLDRSECVLAHSRALVDFGAALRRAGRSAAAIDPLTRGLGIARERGALKVARVATDELRAAGGRPRAAARSNRDSLTPAEQRVARLVGQGLTNRQIAIELFVTPKAVEWHLRHLYRKLGASSRPELVERTRGFEVPV